MMKFVGNSGFKIKGSCLKRAWFLNIYFYYGVEALERRSHSHLIVLFTTTINSEEQAASFVGASASRQIILFTILKHKTSDLCFI